MDNDTPLTDKALKHCDEYANKYGLDQGYVELADFAYRLERCARMMAEALEEIANGRVDVDNHPVPIQIAQEALAAWREIQ